MIERIKAIFARKAPAPQKPRPGHIKTLKDMARAAPPTTKDVPNGDIVDIFGPCSTILLFDAKGRVFQLIGGKMTGMNFCMIAPARTEAISLMDRLDTTDFVIQPGALEQ